MGADEQPSLQFSRLQPPRRRHTADSCSPGLPHLNVALGFVQAVQSELQVGAPSRHYAGAGHVAELSHCFQRWPSRVHGGDTGSQQGPGRRLPDSTDRGASHFSSKQVEGRRKGRNPAPGTCFGQPGQLLSEDRGGGRRLGPGRSNTGLRASSTPHPAPPSIPGDPASWSR